MIMVIISYGSSTHSEKGWMPKIIALIIFVLVAWFLSANMVTGSVETQVAFWIIYAQGDLFLRQFQMDPAFQYPAGSWQDFTLFSTAWMPTGQIPGSKDSNWFLSAAFSIGHGGNDAQRSWESSWRPWSLITLPRTASIAPWRKPCWPVRCIALRHYEKGGWKIVKTMGTKITLKVTLWSVACWNSRSDNLFVTEAWRSPWSTTDTITGSIIGVGATKRLLLFVGALPSTCFWAWILTIPISGLLSAPTFYLLHAIL